MHPWRIEKFADLIERVPGLYSVLSAYVLINLHAQFGDVLRAHHFAKYSEMLHQAFAVSLPSEYRIFFDQLIELQADSIQHSPRCQVRRLILG